MGKITMLSLPGVGGSWGQPYQWHFTNLTWVWRHGLTRWRFTAGFLNLGTVDICSWIILCDGSCHVQVYRRMFIAVPWPPYTRCQCHSTCPHVMTSKNVSSPDIVKCPWGQNLTWLRIIDLEENDHEWISPPHYACVSAFWIWRYCFSRCFF